MIRGPSVLPTGTERGALGEPPSCIQVLWNERNRRKGPSDWYPAGCTGIKKADRCQVRASDL